ncbi:MAG: cytochrome P460 family protein [Candidatus Acidiferrales bacterium]
MKRGKTTGGKWMARSYARKISGLTAVLTVAAIIGAAAWAVRAQSSATSGRAAYDVIRGYRHWNHVRTMTVYDASSPLFADFAGIHNVYVNDVGFKTLRTGGKYADGTVFVFDLFALDGQTGAYAQGKRTALAVMVKDAKGHADTGGWSFAVYADGNPSKQIVKDAKSECFACHGEQKTTDFVFSKWVP